MKWPFFKKDKEEPEAEEGSDYTTDNIVNLANAYSALVEIDPQLLAAGKKARLTKVKTQILNSLGHYCNRLPGNTTYEDKKETD